MPEEGSVPRQTDDLTHPFLPAFTSRLCRPYPSPLPSFTCFASSCLRAMCQTASIPDWAKPPRSLPPTRQTDLVGIDTCHFSPFSTKLYRYFAYTILPIVACDLSHPPSLPTRLPSHLLCTHSTFHLVPIPIPIPGTTSLSDCLYRYFLLNLTTSSSIGT